MSLSSNCFLYKAAGFWVIKWYDFFKLTGNIPDAYLSPL